MNDTGITQDMIAAYLREQEAAELQRRQQVIAEIRALAKERGYTIVGMAGIRDGRIVTDWGIAPADA